MTFIDVEQAADKAPHDAELEVSPTVFIGLGGTGMEVLLRLRRRILQADWNGTRINNLSDFPVARFLYFDTDTNEARESGRAAASDPMAAAVQFGRGDLLQAKVDVGYYQKNKRNHPAIDEWLPARDLSRIDTEKGAGQVRAISRLLFFDVFDQFRSAVAEKGRAVIANITNAPALARLGLKTQRNLRVVVVGSCAGGTGSGAFIDVGLAISSMVDPHPTSVDLFMVLPGGYTGANRDRVFANSYAALAELEHVMRPSPTPAYVRNWTAVDGPSVDKPYSDVFLFDSRNLNGDATGQIGDVFDMMADILFEDFGNSDFARRKRSVSVNQEQHKMRLYHPPLSEDYGRNALAYAQGYSSIGQSILATVGSVEHEAAVVDAGRTMLQAFFGLAAGRQARLPTTEARDRFMADSLLLTRNAYADFPPPLRSKPAAIPGFMLIDQLLQRPDRSSSVKRLHDEIDADFQRIAHEQDDPADWLAAARAVRERRERDVSGAAGDKVGLKYGLRGDEVYEARQRLLAELKSEAGERSVKSRLYNLLDDQDQAGLDYTLELIQQVKHQLALEGQGVSAILERAEAAFAQVADQIMSEELQPSLTRLEQAAKPRLFGGKDRAAATKYLDQIRDDLKWMLEFRMRALAAREARSLLAEVSGFLGDKLPAEEDGEPRWTGLMREFMDGHAAVHKTLALIQADADRVRDALRRPDSGAFIVVGGAARETPEVDSAAALVWARQAFEDFGGCRSLFQMLKTETERLKVLNQLRTIAKARLAHQEERIPTVVDTLRTMRPEERRRYLEKMLSRATPWINGDIQRHKPPADHYKMIIAVKGAREFQEEFGSIVLDLMPARLGISPPGIEESDVKGRIVCYCELSGFPLDFLAPLGNDWRKAYDKEQWTRDPLPLHNHQDDLRFPVPIVPSNAELDALREELRLFLKGVIFGLLQRRTGRGQAYAIDMSVSDWQRVGAERTIRRKRFDPSHRRRLEELVRQFEQTLGPAQTLAASALFDWTARRAYAPRLETSSHDKDARHPGLAHMVARELAAEYLSRFNSVRPRPDLGVTAEQARERLLRGIDDWTTVIEGSLDDIDSAEANRSPEDEPDMLAVDKRAVDPVRFTEAKLGVLISGGPPTPAASPTYATAPPIPPPPPPQALSFYVALNGVTQGPFDLSGLRGLKQSGQLDPQSQVYDALGDGPWITASASPALAALFRPVPPPPPPPPRQA